jgi:hypothetical protein
MARNDFFIHLKININFYENYLLPPPDEEPDEVEPPPELRDEPPELTPEPLALPFVLEPKLPLEELFDGDENVPLEELEDVP